MPAGSDEVVKVQTPAPAGVPVPSVAFPSMKVTVPVGVPPNGGLSAAVKVRDAAG
jgi:hypothetical protein